MLQRKQRFAFLLFSMAYMSTISPADPEYRSRCFVSAIRANKTSSSFVLRTHWTQIADTFTVASVVLVHVSAANSGTQLSFNKDVLIGETINDQPNRTDREISTLKIARFPHDPHIR